MERNREEDGENVVVVLEGEVVKTAVDRRFVDDGARRGTAPPLRRIALRSICDL